MVFSSAHKNTVNGVRFTATITGCNKNKNRNMFIYKVDIGTEVDCDAICPFRNLCQHLSCFDKSLRFTCTTAASLTASAITLPNYKERILLMREFENLQRARWQRWLPGQWRVRPPHTHNGTEAPRCFIKRHDFVRSACHICQSFLIR